MPKQSSGITFATGSSADTNSSGKNPSAITSVTSFVGKSLLSSRSMADNTPNRSATRARDRCLRQKGYRVMRFWNNDVLSNIDGVLLAIDEGLRAIPLRDLG